MKRRILAIVLLVAIMFTAFASVSFAAEEKGTGLYKEGDQWKYYENGSFKKVTGMVKKANANTWHYVENGVYKKATGMVKCVQPNCSATGKWYFVEKGDQSKKTGMVKCIQPGASKGKWYYVLKGKKANKTGVVTCIQPGDSFGKKYYVEKGKKSNKTGVANELNAKGNKIGDARNGWYFKKGKVVNYTGGYTTEAWNYYIVSGEVVDAIFRGNGYSNPPKYSNDKYVINRFSEKFHKPTCKWAKQISKRNKWIVYADRDLLESMGYSPCKVCKP